jgi:hypothetical protein
MVEVTTRDVTRRANLRAGRTDRKLEPLGVLQAVSALPTALLRESRGVAGLRWSSASALRGSRRLPQIAAMRDRAAVPQGLMFCRSMG